MLSRLPRFPRALLAALLLAACSAPAPPPVVPVPIAPTAAPAAPVEPCAALAQHVVGTLVKPMAITFYFTRGTPALDAFVNDLTGVLDDAARASRGKLTVRHVEDAAGVDRDHALDEGLTESTFAEGDPGHPNRVRVVKGFLGLTYHHGAEKEQIPLFDPKERRGVAFFILNRAREVRDREDRRTHRIGLLVGHEEIALGEPNLTSSAGGAAPSIRTIFEASMPFFGFEDVDLRGGDAPIDPALPALVVTQPGKDLSARELRRIDQFMMLGNKTLVVYASTVNVQAGDATLAATFSAHGLDTLLGGYGIELKKGVILDWLHPLRLPVEAQGKQLVLVYPPVLHATSDEGPDRQPPLIDTLAPAFFRADEVAFPFASPLVLHPERQPGATLTPVAQSSSRATVLSREPLRLALTNEWRPEGDGASRVFAASVEGTLASAFGAGTSEGVTLPAAARGGPSRILVVASSQFLANPLARAGNPPPSPASMMGVGPRGDEELQTLATPYATHLLTHTILAFKSTIDWAINDADANACAGRALVAR